MICTDFAFTSALPMALSEHMNRQVSQWSFSATNNGCLRLFPGVNMCNHMNNKQAAVKTKHVWSEKKNSSLSKGKNNARISSSKERNKVCGYSDNQNNKATFMRCIFTTLGQIFSSMLLDWFLLNTLQRTDMSLHWHPTHQLFLLTGQRSQQLPRHIKGS